MPDISIADALSGKAGVDQTVTIKGWVRTRRDSKAGFSFLAINDGSCFDSVQVVAPGTLPNYQNEVMHLTTACSVTATGKLVTSQGKAQALGIQADEIKVL